MWPYVVTRPRCINILKPGITYTRLRTDVLLFRVIAYQRQAIVWPNHKCCDVIMSTIASQITSRRIVYSTVYSDADQGKHQSSASLAFVWGIHRWPVNSPHKWPVTRKMFPFDDVIMETPSVKCRLFCSGFNVFKIILILVYRINPLTGGNNGIRWDECLV